MIQLPVDADLAAVERDMYIIRRRIEAAGRDSALTDLYVCSLSTRSLVYKGMFLAEDLTTFYPDLLDRRFESSFALYHQRYSTNTFPTWWLAQPFRMAAHNGEINTIKGNENWMSCHETRFEHPDLDPFLDDIRPVIAAGSSDTAALDNAFELLCMSGRELPVVKSILIPEAWTSNKLMSQKHKDFYAYCNSVMEPWDGPAAVPPRTATGHFVVWTAVACAPCAIASQPTGFSSAGRKPVWLACPKIALLSAAVLVPAK